MFVDRVKIFIEAGRGGNGLVSFRREKYIPRGGPDGGDGGNGGSVILVAREGVDSLAGMSNRRHWKADPGAMGGSKNCHGRSAEDLIIEVPLGTVVSDAEKNFVIKDMTESGEQLVAAKGGRGGWGNTHFKSSINRVPRQATPGEEGEHRTLILELKAIADVGLIGKPNAGKSTLLSRLSRARPEIADYPFTTKFPNLGQVQINSDRSFIMADIPGLIEGAHQGIGLGHEFLRHIERAGILVHLVEPMPIDGSEPLANYDAIHNELREYNPALVERPELLIVTKAELPNAEEVRAALEQHVGRPVLSLSAVTGAGLSEFLRGVGRLLEERQELQAR